MPSILVRCCAATVALLMLTPFAQAGGADVLKVLVRKSGDTYDFRVTIRSTDTGWDHYADAFEILTGDGQLLATRNLEHPHEDEQPFTRTLDGVAVPLGIERVVVRARLKPNGYDGETVTVELPE